MAIFDIFKKKSNEELPSEPEIFTEEKEIIQPIKTVEEILEIKHFTEAEIGQFVCEYIDAKGIGGLDKEESELAKPFFTSLFFYYHENAINYSNSTYCSRNGCSLNSKQPIFMTASKVLCCDCAVQYIIGNFDNWHYYLGDIVSGIGAVPTSHQRMGTELQKQISKLRQQNLYNRLSSMADEEIYEIVMDKDTDYTMRADAVLKIKSIEILNKIAFEVTSYAVMESLLELTLPKDTVIHLSKQTKNTEIANKVRSKALKNIEEGKFIE